MKILLVHRDTGSRRLLDSLRGMLPGFDLVDSEPGTRLGDVSGVDALLAIGGVDRDLIQRGAFGFVQTMGTGYDHVDIAAATEAGVLVAHLPAAETGNAESVAELAILLMLAMARRLAEAQVNFQQGRWAQPMGGTLFDKTACIVGLGDLGLALAHRLHGMGMRLLATRAHVEKGAPDFVELFSAERLFEALRPADYVIVCARGSSETTNLISDGALAEMKQGACLVNVARGSLVDQEALKRALDRGHLGGAALDVFPEEPADSTQPIFRNPRVIATPHIGGVTHTNITRSLRIVVDNFARFAKGEEPRFLVNRPVFVRGRN